MLRTMATFEDMEKAALRAIFAETPELKLELQRQLDRAEVTKRENTGGGFFTDIALSEDAPPVKCPKVLGYATIQRLD